MRNIVLLAPLGQVGFELLRSLAPLGELVALDRHSTEADGGCGAVYLAGSAGEAAALGDADKGAQHIAFQKRR